MAFKIKHIATRFLLQSIFTILIISVLIFIMFFSASRKQETLRAVTIASEMRSKISLANINLDKAFTLQKADPEFTESSCDALLASQKSTTESILDSLNSLSEIHYLKSALSKINEDDSFRIQLKQHYVTFSKTLLSLKEKGNTGGGLVKKANEAIQKAFNELGMAPDNGLQAATFKSYSSAWLADYSYSKLFAFKNFCDEVVTPFYYLDDYDVSILETNVMELKAQLQRIELIDLRLNSNTDKTGQIKDTELAYENLLISYESFYNAINVQTNKYNAGWNWIFTLLAMLLTITYVLVMGRFSAIVRKSVRGLHRITISLANGNIKDTVPEGGYYEFNTFNKDLKALFGMLNSRKDFIQHLLEDEFDKELEIKAENDEIGNSLVALRHKMQEAKKEQERYDNENNARRYMNEGLTKFAEIMRVNSHDTNLLADEFIKEIVKYMGALQGGLFLTEEGKSNSLDLISSFAFDRKRYIDKTVKFGEGLVGTCAIEQKTINLTEIPGSYVAIKSGLGDTPPNNVLLLPVKSENELVGVIEMASLKVFKEIEIELAESIASSLASTIITSQANLQTSELLKKSQVQAAEMAEQEEEMRQNMEELKATQEESARREEEMQGLLDAIGKSFYVLEYDTNGSIIHANDRLTSFIEQPVDQIMHRTHQDVFSSESRISQKFIQEIIDSKKPESVIETLNWGTKKYQYSYKISPVFSGQGNVFKILNLFSIYEAETES
jgi:PAS domain-containing protein